MKKIVISLAILFFLGSIILSCCEPTGDERKETQKTVVPQYKIPLKDQPKESVKEVLDEKKEYDEIEYAEPVEYNE